ncbi:hypothetical protein Tco_1565882, partial [Tanacetum coccineum]
MSCPVNTFSINCHAREVHATHARIVSGPDPEPMQEDQTGSNSGKLHVSLAGPNPEHMDVSSKKIQKVILVLCTVSGPDPEPVQEDQTGSDPGTRDEGQAGPNPDDIRIAKSLPLPTLSVLAGPNLEHSDVEIT